LSTCTVKYLGDLRTEATHTKSGHSFVTDAPTDNHGKGEAFSPTDLIAASLLTCMITVMGIAAKGRGWDMGEVDGEVKKTMTGNPRRVASLHTKIRFKNNHLNESQRHLLEQIAIDCPVAKSLDPAIEQPVEFEYL
jgi:uncharacterized OsmC-like protein